LILNHTTTTDIYKDSSATAFVYTLLSTMLTTGPVN
jgi:hypothetical protein